MSDLTPEQAAKQIDEAFKTAVGSLTYTQKDSEQKETQLFIVQSSE